MFNGFQATVEIRPLATGGIAYNRSLLTLALDAELNSWKTFDELGESQFARPGFKFNVVNWTQLWAGYRHDFEGSRQDMESLGWIFYKD